MFKMAMIVNLLIMVMRINYYDMYYMSVLFYKYTWFALVLVLNIFNFYWRI